MPLQFSMITSILEVSKYKGSIMHKLTNIVLSVTAILFITACGGGSSSGGDNISTPTPTPPSSVIPETPQVIALNKIKSYAADNTQPAPTVQDYLDAGVLGVTSENIDEINEVVATLTPNDVNTPEKIQNIVNELGINIVPSANAGPDLKVQVNKSIFVRGIGVDIDGSIVSYKWSKGATLLSTNASFEYTATTVGVDTLTFTVTDDDGATASDTINVTVLETEVEDTIAPVITLNGSSTEDIIEGESYTDAGATAIDNIDGPVEVSTTGIVDTSKVGVYTITYTAVDNAGNKATETRTVNVLPATVPNTPPVANAGIDQNVNIGADVTLNGSASSDAEGDELTYQWSFVSKPDGSTATLSDINIVTPTFTVDKSGDYIIQLIVNDGTVNSAADTVTVIAAEENFVIHVSNTEEFRQALLDAAGNGRDDTIVLADGVYKTTDDGKGTFMFIDNESNPLINHLKPEIS